MPAAVLSFPRQSTKREFAVLELARPGEPRVTAGVLLIDNDSLAFRLRTDWSEIDLEEDDEEYLQELPDDFTAQIAVRGAQDFLHELESSASNFLIVSDREPAGSASVHDLYDRFVDGTVRPFLTHLPVFTLQAAATRFGEDAEVSESGWRRVDGIRLTEGMFVAQVVGRSMEPVIPDGSFCVFRSPVVGSREGKRLLIEQFGATETSARYTVKRYSSTKVHDGDSWEHASIRLHPLNPEFPAFDLEDGSFRVIAEFVRTLPD